MKTFFSALSETSRVMVAAVGAICFIFLILGLFIIKYVYPFEEALPFAAGISIGCVHSMVKVVLLEKSISHSVDMKKEHAQTYASFQAIARYFLTIAVLAVVIIFPGVFGLFGVIIGIVSLQFSAYATNFILQKK